MRHDVTIRPEDLQRTVTRNASVPDDSRHWSSRRDSDGVETLTLDRADAKANTLNRAVLLELEAIIEQLRKDPPTGVIIASGKPDHFIYGGDVREFLDYTDKAEIEELVGRVHKMLKRLEGLRCPTVAMMHGACLGGGLELALACDRRVARNDASIGFPEIRLGIHPGFGGTVRMTRQLPPPTAMRMMLTGRTVNALRARTMGLVDDVQPERHLEASARAALARGGRRRRTSAKNWLLNTRLVRDLLAQRMRAETIKRAPKQHYPAPHALIDLWAAHGGDADAMMRAEARSLAELLTGPTARNLIRIFLLRERLKSGAGRPEKPLQHVHVVGSGVMGGDIAAWCALQGLHVTVTDLELDQIAGAVGRADKLFAKETRRRTGRRNAHDRLTPDPSGNGVRRADLVIEAVAEDLDVKRKVFKDIEARAGADAVLATNTSSIPLEDIAEGLDEPGRLIGLHFFNPVARLPLVEVVSSAHSTKQAAQAGAAFCGRIGKLPLRVQSTPGFLVNRALMPYMLEAMLVLQEGTRAETIDRAAMDFGMPIGPIELADQVGLDIALDVGRIVGGGDTVEPPDRLRRLVDAGKLGRKTGEGFYRWHKGSPERGDPGEVPAELADRLILPLVNALAALVRDGVVDDADAADAGAVFGIGFAPFRGGPLNYACERGIDDVTASLRRLAERHDDRFTPDPYWSRLGHG